MKQTKNVLSEIRYLNAYYKLFFTFPHRKVLEGRNGYSRDNLKYT